MEKVADKTGRGNWGYSLEELYALLTLTFSGDAFLGTWWSLLCTFKKTSLDRLGSLEKRGRAVAVRLKVGRSERNLENEIDKTCDSLNLGSMVGGNTRIGDNADNS